MDQRIPSFPVLLQAYLMEVIPPKLSFQRTSRIACAFLIFNATYITTGFVEVKKFFQTSFLALMVGVEPTTIPISLCYRNVVPFGFHSQQHSGGCSTVELHHRLRVLCLQAAPFPIGLNCYSIPLSEVKGNLATFFDASQNIQGNEAEEPQAWQE